MKMKILIDVNNLIYASFFVNYSMNKSEFTIGMVYHLFLNKLLMLKRKFKVNNNNIILTFDHKIMWRRKYFQYYKVKRQELREKSGIDFKQLFEIIDNIYCFLFENCSFITLRHKFLECDDWIGILTKYYKNEDVIIVSSDKDFYQCHSERIKQFDHIKNKYISINNPKLELMIKILSGDKTDGIPNILSDGDTFCVKEKRQKAMGEKKILNILREKNLKLFLTENNCIENFKRNKKLISFEEIPLKIQKLIIEKVKNYKIKRDRLKVMAFLHNNRLNQISNQIDMLLD